MQKRQEEITTIIKLILLIFFLVMNISLPGFSEESVPASIDEMSKIQQDALSQIESKYQQAIEDLNIRKQQEINIIESSYATDLTKEKLKNKIEQKYLKLQNDLDTKNTAQKKETMNYYSSLKQDIQKELNVGPNSNPKKIFVQPQKLVGSWVLEGYKFIGTLKFSANKGVLVSNIHLLMYNKWEDIYNLTYDGYNLAFDYENPYGIKLHFEGTIDPEAKMIKGTVIDLKDNQKYDWKAYR